MKKVKQLILIVAVIALCASCGNNESQKETKETLKKVPSREEAIEHLINETNLSEEECSKAYDFLINLDFDKK